MSVAPPLAPGRGARADRTCAALSRNPTRVHVAPRFAAGRNVTWRALSTALAHLISTRVRITVALTVVPSGNGVANGAGAAAGVVGRVTSPRVAPATAQTAPCLKNQAN